MTTQARIRPADRRDRKVAEVIRTWRRLTGGPKVRDSDRRTLIGCSAGADSSALVLALAAATDRIIVAHVVHDLRPEADALADRDAARTLASALGLRFVEASVRVRSVPGNAEASARRERYRELVRLARDLGCGFVAVAHHADDQLETMLMRLARGAGPRGLSGMRAARRLEHGVRLVRPMLRLTRQDARDICRACAWEWREDATNADESRTRAAVRAGAAARLRELNPRVGIKAAEAAELLAGAAELVSSRAEVVLARAARDPDGRIEWLRAVLSAEPAIVVGEALRLAHRELSGGAAADRLRARSLTQAARAVIGEPSRPRLYRLGKLCVEVTSRLVVVSRQAQPRPRGV